MCKRTMASLPLDAPGCFSGESDRFNGISVDTSALSVTDTEFEEQLKVSLSGWQELHIRGLWFKVPLVNASYIPILAKHGFDFHHTKDGYLMMTKWLPKTEPNLLPPFPHTYVGVGGLVVNKQNQVLVIQEKYQTRPHWKLPGGYANPGEEFSDTARREVLEETGIDTRFISVVAFRHHHKHLFGCSDLYVVCEMQPLNEDIQPSSHEVKLCQWMDVDAYKSHPLVTDMNRFIIKSFLKNREHSTTINASEVLSFNKDCYQNVYRIESG